MTRWLSRAGLVLILGTVASCGFQLRGTPELPAAMRSTYLEAPDRDSLLVRKLVRALRLADVEVVPARNRAQGVLQIHTENSGQRILSVTAAGGPEEYEVFHTVDFSYRADDGEEIKRQTVTLTRDYTFDRNDVLGKEREYDSLRAALADEMAMLMLRRLSLAAQ